MKNLPRIKTNDILKNILSNHNQMYHPHNLYE